MTDITSLNITLGTFFTIITILLAIKTFKRNEKKDQKEEVKEGKNDEARLIGMEKDIQYIRVSIDNVMDGQKEQKNEINKHSLQLTKIESEIENFKTRADGFEKDIRDLKLNRSSRMKKIGAK